MPGKEAQQCTRREKGLTAGSSSLAGLKSSGAIATVRFLAMRCSSPSYFLPPCRTERAVGLYVSSQIIMGHTTLQERSALRGRRRSSWHYNIA